MLANIKLPELIIILVIIVLIFGVGRLTKIGGEMGGAIRSFRKGLKGDEQNEKPEEKKDE
ncbi:MAG: twin-arginine translocase TatA/TatE family subunit [Chlorobiales bacterium]|nr:twin-arginine translocase TatA/TatE family subunit [Chlorobiales bacterium]